MAGVEGLGDGWGRGGGGRQSRTRQLGWRANQWGWVGGVGREADDLSIKVMRAPTQAQACASMKYKSGWVGVGAKGGQAGLGVVKSR